MKPYHGRLFGSDFLTLTVQGHIKPLGGEWYWTAYHVAYTAPALYIATNHVTIEDATTEFEKRLASIRAEWTATGAPFVEQLLSDAPESLRVRFRSIRSNGKPGSLSALLTLNRIIRD